MFSVKLDAFCGPMDLLLYLVRKRELNVFDVAIAEITEQYLFFIETLEALNLDSIGEFLSLASALIEIKSYQALPNEDEDEKVVEEIDDPRKDLVAQLLAYRKFCENTGVLEERARLWQRRYPRLSNDIPAKTRNIAEEPIQDVELWDLVGAFGRILREREPVFRHTMKREETPLSVHVERLYRRLKRERAVQFTALFDGAVRKSTLIGIFLAILELTRHGYAYVEQETSFGDITVSYRENSQPFDLIKMNVEESLAQAG
ncbi:MAG: segregation/condensation protein A [Thermoguttaceae bacterium]|jgi:segregation and condensation protein A|nr:segregation/condensation protein A [Thermoguttaceae bacterium]